MNRNEYIQKLEDCEKYAEGFDPLSADTIRATLSAARSLPIPKGACCACGQVIELASGLVGKHKVSVTTLNSYRIDCKGAGLEPAKPRSAPAVSAE